VAAEMIHEFQGLCLGVFVSDSQTMLIGCFAGLGTKNAHPAPEPSQTPGLSMGSRLFIPNPFCVRPAPMMRKGALGGNLVCCRDHFAADPTRRGFAADCASATPPGTSPVNPVALTWLQTRSQMATKGGTLAMIGKTVSRYGIVERLGGGRWEPRRGL